MLANSIFEVIQLEGVVPESEIARSFGVCGFSCGEVSDVVDSLVADGKIIRYSFGGRQVVSLHEAERQ